MEQKKNLLIFILAMGTFSILNTEVGILGILPNIAARFAVDIPTAGLLVSGFALAIFFAGTTMPLLLSKMERKRLMLFVLGFFIVCNAVSFVAPTFEVALAARIAPAFVHPVYCSLAYVIAAELVGPERAPQAAAKIMIGVSSGIVIGIPVTAFLANTFSYEAAMGFFILMNVLAFLGTLRFFPAMPVTQAASIGSQLGVLKKAKTWVSLFVVSSVGAALFTVYAYISSFLLDVTKLTSSELSIALFVFGISSIAGNYVGGRLLTADAKKTALVYPFVFSAVYLAVSLLGASAPAMFLLLVGWGMMNGIGNNIQQHWIVSAIPEAVGFANGLFISFGNLGTTLGTTVGGLLLGSFGFAAIFFGGIGFLALTFAAVVLRVVRYERRDAAPAEVVEA